MLTAPRSRFRKLSQSKPSGVSQGRIQVADWRGRPSFMLTGVSHGFSCSASGQRRRI